MAKNKYDSLIIGSGFDALFTAVRLQNEGATVAIIEKEESVGGLYRPLKAGEQWVESHINFIANEDGAEAALQEIQKICPDLVITPFELGPVTFHNGQAHPFVGFSESSVEGLEQYSAFTNARQLSLSMGLGTLVRHLKEKFTGEVFLQSEITAFEIEPEIQAVINGTQKISSRDVYVFETPHWLSKHLSAGTHGVPKTLPQKLSKIPLWTAVNLSFHHSRELTQSQAIHVLYGAKEQPCIGRFHTDGDVISSQWTTFVNAETAADSEALGSAIREMKKQIKRMYPTFFENVAKEYIVISPDAYGALPHGLIEKGLLTKAPQVKLGSRFYTEAPGVWGDLVSLRHLMHSPALMPEPTDHLTI